MEKQDLRSFGRIHGKRLSARQAWLVENVLPMLNPVGANNHLPLRPAILEIGFGAGEHLLHLAKTFPDHIIIGAEPFINGVASLLSQMTNTVGANNIRPDNTADSKSECYSPLQLIKPEYHNIHIWPDDIRKFFTNCTLHSANCTFTKIYILHPDPWPKARHEKRRLLTAEFLNELAAHLTPGGQIIIGTDHTEHFNWVLNNVQCAACSVQIKNKKIKNNAADNCTLQTANCTLKSKSHSDFDFMTPPEPGLDTRYQRKNKFGSEKPMYLVLKKS